MIYVVIWVACGLIAVAIAQSKGQSTFGAFLIGILLGPIGVLLVALTKTDTAKLETQQLAAGAMRKCPHCAELVRSEATVCRYCQRDLTPPPVDPSVARIVPNGTGGYTCSACGGGVRLDATVCKHCQKPLSASAAVYAQSKQN